MKKIIFLSSFVFLLSLGCISCSKNADKPCQVQNSIQEDSNPSSFSYTIPKDMLEQELLALMEAKEEEQLLKVFEQAPIGQSGLLLTTEEIVREIDQVPNDEEVNKSRLNRIGRALRGQRFNRQKNKGVYKYGVNRRK